MSYNKIIVMGRLTKTPELRSTPSGTPVCECRLAFDNGWGENKKSCFIDVTVWGKQAEFVAKYFTKGAGILIDGRLEMDTWKDKTDGKDRSKHYIVAERATFPISAGKGGGASPEEDYAPASASRGASAGSHVDTSDDIPF
ncbi:MAG: single-stranded DNA-binding protein [Planctomycetota bacterium]